MYKEEAIVRSRRTLIGSFLLGVLVILIPGLAFAAGSVSLAWSPSSDSNVAGYNIYFGGTSGAYTNMVTVGNATNATVSGLIVGSTYYFAATTYSAAGVESPFSSEIAYLVPAPGNPTNQPPTLNAIGNVAINENDGLQTVGISGITSGAASENQVLGISAVSGNPGLIPNPTVHYTSPNTNGTLTFTPTANANGTATITVTVNDGGPSNNIVTQSFTVTVSAVNQTPTLNLIGNLTINGNAGLQTINLSGITSGAANENQVLGVSAVSGNPALISNPTVNYTSPNTSGTLSFTPVANSNGTAVITVTVNDGGTSNNIVKRSITVTVNAVNTGSTNQPPTLNPISNQSLTVETCQRLTLTGISSGTPNLNSAIQVTAVSDNVLVVRPKVGYSSPGTSGALTLQCGHQAGTANLAVTVNNGAKSNNIITRTFTVTVVSRHPKASQVTVNGAPTHPISAGMLAKYTAKLSPAAHANGQYALTVAGSSGCRYVVEASTDMVNWVPVQTNRAPFKFVDTQAGQFSQRFYRSVFTP